MKYLFAILSFLIGIYVFNFLNCSSWESASIGFFFFFFLDMLYGLGKRIVILDLPIVMAFFTWLVMPVIFYHNYTAHNYLAYLWNAYMPIPSDEYFSFVLPGSLLMVFGYKLKLYNSKVSQTPKLYIENLKNELKGKSYIGFILLFIGIFSDALRLIIPDTLRQVVFLLQNLKYVGVFYIYFSDFKNKKTILITALGFLIASSIVTGMFGEFIFLLVLSLVLISLSWRKARFASKLIIVFAGLFLILVIQNIKKDYRRQAWRGSGSDAGYFAELIVDRISNPEVMFRQDNLFFMGSRMNQGLLIGRTMLYVPDRFPYANGETIWKSVAASVIPRVVWPDKPQAGGKYNLKRFWGFDIKRYSMNIGPIGEAYGNFGTMGGIIYMFFYGLFFNIILTVLLKKTERHPTFLCWIPFLFLNAISVETDLLTTMNSLVTAMIFMFMLMWFFKKILKIKV